MQIQGLAFNNYFCVLVNKTTNNGNKEDYFFYFRFVYRVNFIPRNFRRLSILFADQLSALWINTRRRPSNYITHSSVRNRCKRELMLLIVIRERSDLLRWNIFSNIIEFL